MKKEQFTNFEKYQNLADFLLDSQDERVELEAIKKAEFEAKKDLEKEANKWNY